MLKALVVEDEEDIKQLLRDELEDKGYKVIEACNGEINLEQATAEIPLEYPVRICLEPLSCQNWCQSVDECHRHSQKPWRCGRGWLRFLNPSPKS